MFNTHVQQTAVRNVLLPAYFTDEFSLASFIIIIIIFEAAQAVKQISSPPNVERKSVINIIIITTFFYFFSLSCYKLSLIPSMLFSAATYPFDLVVLCIIHPFSSPAHLTFPHPFPPLAN